MNRYKEAIFRILDHKLITLPKDVKNVREYRDIIECITDEDVDIILGEYKVSIESVIEEDIHIRTKGKLSTDRIHDIADKVNIDSEKCKIVIDFVEALIQRLYYLAYINPKE